MLTMINNVVVVTAFAFRLDSTDFADGMIRDRRCQPIYLVLSATIYTDLA